MLMDSLNVKQDRSSPIFERQPAGSLSEHIKSVTAVNQTRNWQGYVWAERIQFSKSCLFRDEEKKYSTEDK